MKEDTFIFSVTEWVNEGFIKLSLAGLISVGGGGVVDGHEESVNEFVDEDLSNKVFTNDAEESEDGRSDGGRKDREREESAEEDAVEVAEEQEREQGKAEDELSERDSIDVDNDISNIGDSSSDDYDDYSSDMDSSGVSGDYKSENTGAVVENEEVATEPSEVGQTFEATAYTARCEGCSGITRSGVDVRNTELHEGNRVVAVDPSVIPLDSTVEVTLSNGSSFIGTAQDTGGAIKGNRIDILYATTDEAVTFGRQDVQVRVIQ